MSDEIYKMVDPIEHAWLKERHRLTIKALQEIVEVLHRTLHNDSPARECLRRFCQDMVANIETLTNEEPPDAEGRRDHP